MHRFKDLIKNPTAQQLQGSRSSTPLHSNSLGLSLMVVSYRDSPAQHVLVGSLATV